VRPKPLLCACLLALGVAGCGTADRERDAAAAAERFHAALETRDGQAACAELNPETASKLEQQEKKPCEEAIVTLELSRPEPGGLVGLGRRLPDHRARAALRLRAGGLRCG
jgi:hypothetical protein